MLYLLYVFIFLLIFTNVKSFIRYVRVKKYLQENLSSNIKLDTDKKICIIIPVYKEVPHIEKSIKYFKELAHLCDIYYVTTSKETNMETYNEIQKQIKKQSTSNIFLYNSPNTQGTMAHQLNYMAKKLPDGSIIGIYNIDSFPDKNTFKYVIKNINKNEVYQQVSFFDDSIKNPVLNSAQNWQNRWSLLYEMGKYLKQTGKNNFIYTIGHGLFLTKDILDSFGYWSENEINEDNEFGYRLVCNGVQIKPIPFMEKADFARTIKIYIKQQSTWINGPLYAFSYYKKQKNKTLKDLWLAFLNFKAFVSWMFFPVLFLIFSIMAYIYNYIYLIILLILITFYITVFNYVSRKLLIKYKYIKSNNRINPISDYIFFIIHSFGGFITIFKIIIGKNNQKNKYNTEK